jgi:hypothetical protein
MQIICKHHCENFIIFSELYKCESLGMCDELLFLV